MKKYILIFILSILGINSYLNAQVTIGSTNQPADYSVLELDATEVKGGLLLPRLSGTQATDLRDYLQSLTPAECEKAKGLVIYDTDADKLKYWTGTDWANIDQENQLAGGNGLSVIDNLRGGLKLGGTITDNQTVVSIGAGNSLSFSGNDANSKFRVTFGDDAANPSLIVRNNKIGIGTDNPQMQLDIKAQDPTDNTEKPLRIAGSQEKPNYILASDRYGNALWQPFRPVSSVIEGEVSDGTIAGIQEFGAFKGSVPPTTVVRDLSNEEMNLTPSTGTLKLGRGKWLIVAKYTSYAVVYTGQSTTNASSICYNGCTEKYYHYIKLKKRRSANSSIWDEITVMGSLPEQKADTYTLPGGGTQSRYYTSPQLFYYYENDTDIEHELAIFGSTSRQAFLSNLYGGSFFQALRIDGLLSTEIAVSAKATCNFSGTTSFTMSTGDMLDQTLTGTLNLRLYSGTLELNAGDEIGSANGLKLEVVGGPYIINTGGTGTNINVKVKGQLADGVLSNAPFTIPVKIPGVSFPGSGDNCNVVTITVNTKGSLDNSRYDRVYYSGEGRTINVNKSLSLEVSSGSITLNPGDALGNAYGIYATYAGASPITFRSIGSYTDYIPVNYSGTVTGAPATFSIPIQLSGTTPAQVSPVDGLTVNVVDGALDCGTGVKVPSNVRVSTSGKINLTLTSASGPYKLAYNTLLGTSGAGISIRYAGSERILAAGSSTDLDVTYVSSSVLATGTYYVPLTDLYASGVNIDECTATVTVEDYGSFNCASLGAYTIQGISSENILINAPLAITVNNGTVNLRAGDVLGEVVYSGKPYKVTVQDPISLTGTSGSPATGNVNVRISGDAINSPGSFTIPLNKIPGVQSCNLTMTFKHFGSYDCSSVPQHVSKYPTGASTPTPINYTGNLTINVTDGGIVFNNGDVLGSNGDYTVKVETASPIVINSASTVNIPIRVTGPGSTSNQTINIDLNKKKGVTGCSISIKIEEDL